MTQNDMFINLNKECKIELKEIRLLKKPLVLYNHATFPEYQSGLKFAMFDLDDTLITTQSGSFFQKDKTDWRLKYPNVGEKLRSLKSKGYEIVIITNQMGISKEHIRIEDFVEKMKNFTDSLQLELLIIVAVDDNEFRKPSIGSFFYFIDEILNRKHHAKNQRLQVNQINRHLSVGKKTGQSVQTQSTVSETQKGSENATVREESPPNLKNKSKKRDNTQKQSHKNVYEFEKNFYYSPKKTEVFALGAKISTQSFFCGDAAGREQLKIKDFSNSDLLFAINCKINFSLPESIFKDKYFDQLEDIPTWPYFDQIETNENSILDQINVTNLETAGKQNVLVLMVGPSSSGKTFLCQKIFKKEWNILNYVILTDS